jgi:hypothetical protein
VKQIMVDVVDIEDPFFQHLTREIDKAKALRGWESWPLRGHLRKKLKCDIDDAVKLWETVGTADQAHLGLMALADWLKKNPAPLLVEWRDCLLALTQMLAFRFLSENSLVSAATNAAEIDDLGFQDRNAAAVAAAIARNRPLHLHTSESAQGVQAGNLIESFAALEFGHFSGEQAMQAELEAACNLTIDIQTFDHRKTHLEKYKTKSLPRPTTTQGLVNYLKEDGIEFLVLLAKNQSHQLSAEALACLRDHYQINPLCYGEQEKSTVEGDIIERVIDPILIRLLSPTERKTVPNPPPNSPLPSVFISYAHKDKEWLKALQEHLGGLKRQGRLSVWEDTQIDGGDDWFPEIEKAMLSAQVAVMLISPSFLGSSFIDDTEVPTLLKRRKEEGLRVLPVLIRDCVWDHVDWLKNIQMRPGGKPLNLLTEGECDQALANIAREIAKFLAPSAQ